MTVALGAETVEAVLKTGLAGIRLPEGSTPFPLRHLILKGFLRIGLGVRAQWGAGPKWIIVNG
jgi:hypothetical protein